MMFKNFNCRHPSGSFNQPLSYFAGLWPSDLVWERHVNAAAGRNMKRRKWDESSEIFLFTHLMPSFLVLVMIAQIFIIRRWKKKKEKVWNHNRKRTNQIKWGWGGVGGCLDCNTFGSRLDHMCSKASKRKHFSPECCGQSEVVKSWTG